MITTKFIHMPWKAQRTFCSLGLWSGNEPEKSLSRILQFRVPPGVRPEKKNPFDSSRV
jgi:hypothetical protein